MPRHCSVSSSNQNAMENSNSVFEEDGDFDLAAEEEKGKNCGVMWMAVIQPLPILQSCFNGRSRMLGFMSKANAINF
ncbi:uncharacterized protein LOC112326270 isoform X3 [Populus trichocarpa]|uniref:uncharacterized protein LOC112326270 isoform X3 n=1 Tax=Populus trichocarpa TaxID=3694 RepID=UPI000D18B08C|nr:uncharacterized protein LOC112326270 isoform X3 [Populus trichocarpa]|eukprot:XP_024449434.1 uncharacterized protein LOC112326270 isoform X3 [Populus trichocarpa]